ncbi:DNA polymerase III subunit epsilon [Hyphomicrobium sp.]|uniref:DNA polymerase III subunit epsilon n=1 Tax=Hyphomicrobium sp. TaxID=82 RepID=UPI000FB1BD4F|nr:DNA polymerase III subunit epsilon [Hyphomicrobium sp.]RUP00266.1 MAG: DNA polymerase III subunit epsilon [Hyphomicrobium sp.]
MREIVLDTETTGLDPKTGHRLIEVGGIEMINRIPTGREFHRFINPQRDVPREAQEIHGISTEFLFDKPLFKDVARELLDFLGNDILVIHNAQFDIMFLNHELGLLGEKAISFDRVVDTLAIARRRHPAGPNTLDALCKRYAIDNSQRTKHGALVDSLLLAEVYVELLGERQATFGLQSASVKSAGAIRVGAGRSNPMLRSEPLPARIGEAEVEAHRSFIEKMKTPALWLSFWNKSPA